MSGAAVLPNSPVTFTLAAGPRSQSCATTTNASGLASCTITPRQPAAAYAVTASYSGSSVPFLAPVDTSASFVVTLEQDTLTYTGPITAAAGQQLDLAAALSTDDPAAGSALAGRTIRFTLGSGAGAVSCNGLTDASGGANCLVIVPSSQPAGSVAASATFVSDTFYVAAAVTAAVTIPGFPGVSTPEVGSGQAMPWLPGVLLVLAGGVVVAVARRRR